MFHRILIANRGEIACRIIRTARSMGIETVLVYSKADEYSLAVSLADHAMCIGEAPSLESYLNIEAIIQAAQKTQANAIHPGYGFLSENPSFARACEQAGIVFIGPNVKAMEIMASKQAAKLLVEQTEIPLIPGYHGSDQSEQKLLNEAEKIGFPILIKASQGGGGKGMRMITHPDEFKTALHAAKREALSSFADDTIILEKYLSDPRHIEVQIMADHQGQVVSLFERDCSIQRRHQKIIEEAPALGLPAALRQQLSEAACSIASLIDYQGAGTIEFLVDSNNLFYFMEMNTRLQVEHAVTEMITGIDLVAWQIKIAAKEPLPLAQEQIKAHGHSLECRIYAEDPFHDFMPCVGEVRLLEEPHGEGIRIDSGVTVNSSISRYYDPMIAKLITWGNTRTQALQRMQMALNNYFLGGVTTNIPFLQEIIQHPVFEKGHYNTFFLDNECVHITQPSSTHALIAAAAFEYLKQGSELTNPVLKSCFAWQLNGSTQWIKRYVLDDVVCELKIQPVDIHNFLVCLDQKTYSVCVQLQPSKALRISLDGAWIKAFVLPLDDKITVLTAHGQTTVKRFSWEAQLNSTSTQGQLTAPMPATVVAVLKNKGDGVQKGERLMVLEAMKMEHTIHAPMEGVVSEVFYPVGAQVSEGAALVSLEAISSRSINDEQ